MGRNPPFDWADAVLPPGSTVDTVGGVCGCADRLPASSAPGALDWSLAAFRPSRVESADARPLAVATIAGVQHCGCEGARQAPSVAEGGSAGPTLDPIQTPLTWEPDDASVIDAILHASGGSRSPIELPAELITQALSGPRRAAASRTGARERGSAMTGEACVSVRVADREQPDSDAPSARRRASASDVATQITSSVVSCGMSPRSAFGSEIASLRDVCTINLGSCAALYPTEADPLAYTLDDGLLPIVVRRKEVFERYLPDWVAKRTIALTEVDGMLNLAGTPFDGLFWYGDGGFLRGALRFALVTLHTYAEFLTEPRVFSIPCKTSTSGQLRDAIANDGWTKTYRADFTRWTVTPVGGWPACGTAESVVNVGADGLVTVSLPSWPQHSYWRGNIGGAHPSAVTPGFGGIVYLGDTSICPPMWTTAALADYFFWWAARLYAQYLFTGDEKADRVGRACAKAAMAEIASLTGLLAHEWTHVSGSWFEDEDDWCQNACHHLLGELMTHRLIAEFGTPFPLTIHGWDSFSQWSTTATRSTASSAMTVADRFDLSRSASWKASIFAYPAGPADSFTGSDLSFTHEEPMTERHPLKATWSVMNASCWTEIDDYEQVGEAFFNRDGPGEGRNR